MMTNLLSDRLAALDRLTLAHGAHTDRGDAAWNAAGGAARIEELWQEHIRLRGAA